MSGTFKNADPVSDAEHYAELLLLEAGRLEGATDRRRRRRVGAIIADQASREFLMDLTDQVLRIGPPRRAARRLNDLVAERGIPSFAGEMDRLALVLGARLAPVVPQLVMPLVTSRLRREFGTVVLPANPARLARHVRRRAAEHIRLNVNLLGEAVLGDDEARWRTELVIGLLGRPEVDYISVKISSVCAQLDVVAYEHSLARIVDRLRTIYTAAAAAKPAKFINLDMEEYRDLNLTIDAFTTLLAERQFADLDAGIVLQAYLPDSYAALERLACFARKRHVEHGSAVKVRLVKGANLAMERVEAELRGWEQAPYATKAEVDANYMRLLDLALAPENAGALRIGVASHNLFDIGWALALRDSVGADRVEVEMLEGMANAQALAVSRTAGGLLLYAPIVRRDDFESAVAYLVRRFDENTAPENFLSHVFDLRLGSPAWVAERSRFEDSVTDRLLPPGKPRRTQDRAAETRGPAEAGSESAFANAPDTDFALGANRAWLNQQLGKRTSPRCEEVPAVVDSERVTAPLSGVGIDPSEPSEPLYRYVEADLETVERAVATARRSCESWRAKPAAERRAVLHAVGCELAADRGECIAVMSHDAGKTVGEADPEVSEAIDFARYYGDQAVRLERSGTAYRFDPYRVVVVVPPWNFPLAIPAGGVLAALAAGAAVILKPAPETVLTAWSLVRCCWAAGVPKDVLQFVPCADDEIGRRLVSHEDVDAVILTGAFDTARLFLEWRPGLALHAETSGKNAVVITAAADQDDAIRDLLRSAFSHSGQKCSAASLAIIEAPLYDDRRFLARLADAVRTLRVGPAWDPVSQVGPLIRPPSGPLARALRELAPGEQWLVRPCQVGDNPHLWSPGVKLGVAPGSEFHLTECFGPLLGIMRAADLDEAIRFQNAPRYGLTGGIHTLEDREVSYWLGRVQVGNAFVNRHITGAIVQRQPFGGWKRSAIGPGAKAGGPHYVASLGSWRAVGPLQISEELQRARQTWQRLSAGEDPSKLRSERNSLRLVALHSLSLRLGAVPDPDALEIALDIAGDLRVELEISAENRWPGLPAATMIEPDSSYVSRIARRQFDRIRLVGADAKLRLELLDAGFEVDVQPLCPIGPIELLRWTREQAVSETFHRHGNVRRRD
ncbi:MAG: bifunctional proline dehydrogenase/L-glutamate gamma-semialdehyde dehydrogenase [Acidimicrobiales bacterium]|jgi:RHH-type proline utilization regulon transcriptional repressor/proline dehydrogenase/delta 1-pyrroline-5-carboxylate dehydrogenase